MSSNSCRKSARLREAFTKSMRTQSSKHVRSAMRGYLATIYLGLFMTTSSVPQGYMPLVNHGGSVQIVACSGTDKKAPTEDHAIGSTYDCPLSILQLSLLPHAEIAPVLASNSPLKPSCMFYNLAERNYGTALSRGPPPIS